MAHFFLSHLSQTQQHLLEGLLPDCITSPFLIMGNFYFPLQTILPSEDWFKPIFKMLVGWHTILNQILSGF